MKQRRVHFDPYWALASIAIGVIATLAATVGAGKAGSIEFLADGAFIGLCIYVANILAHDTLGPRIDRMPKPMRITTRIVVSIVAGVIGWQVAYVLLVFVGTGTLAFPVPSGRMRWLLLLTIAITVLVAAFAQVYDQLKQRLSESIERLKENEFAEKELELARSIQSRLLPPPYIEGEGFTITARNLPAHFVAGDFYDVLRHEDGSVGIVIADVSGKGIGASLIMASVKAVLPFVANGAVDETLRRLNERLVTQLGRREFVALAYARFQPATGKLRMANAGMPDPYLLSGGSATPVVVDGERLPLGVRTDVRYGTIEVDLRPGDRFLLLSDGIPEAPRESGEPLGYDAVRATVSGIAADDRWLDTFVDRIHAQVKSVDDDWTAVLLERRV